MNKKQRVSLNNLKSTMNRKFILMFSFLAYTALLYCQIQAKPIRPNNITIGRAYVIQQSINIRLSVNDGKWNYIEPGSGPVMDINTNIELSNDPAPQLYDLVNDPGERKNLAILSSDVLQRMKQLLAGEKNKTAE